MTSGPQQAQRSALSVEQSGLIATAITLVLGAALLALLFPRGAMSLDGPDSVGGGAQLLVLLVGVIAVPVVFSRSARGRAQPVARRILSTTTLTFAVTATATLLVSAAFTVFALALPAVQIDWAAGIGIGAVVAAVVAYLIVGLVSDLSTRDLATLLSVFLVGGVLSAMFAATNGDWWQENFSSLDIVNSNAADAFNFTLVIGGLMVVTLADFLAIDLDAWLGARIDRKRVRLIRSWLIACGIAMTGVGLVPISAGQPLHAVIATVMMALFGVLVAALPALIPALPLGFKIVSYTALGLIAVAALLWVPVGYFNLTAVEFVAAVILFVWLTLLVRTVAAGAKDAGGAEEVVVPPPSAGGTGGLARVSP